MGGVTGGTIVQGNQGVKHIMENKPTTRVFRRQDHEYSEERVNFNVFGKEDHGVAVIKGPENHYKNFAGNSEHDTGWDDHRSLDPDGKLFTHAHTPAKLHALLATGKQHVGPLIGMAAREAKSRWGEDLKPSNDLSEHSAPIVAKLRDKGVVPKSSRVSAGNQMSKRDARDEEGYKRSLLADHDLPDTVYSPLGHEQQHALYRQGSQLFKQTLRNARPSNASAQFPQKETLF